MTQNEAEQSAAEPFTAYRLASMAECSGPDSLDSPGAKFLLDVQAATREHIESGGDPEELHEIADNAPDAYTWPRWQEFVDLGAWREDLSDLGGLGSMEDMTEAAGVALYQIADRLAHALVEEWSTDDE